MGFGACRFFVPLRTCLQPLSEMNDWAERLRSPSLRRHRKQWAVFPADELASGLRQQRYLLPLIFRLPFRLLWLVSRLPLLVSPPITHR